MKLIDVTGEDELVPVCPSHKHVALKSETIKTVTGEVVGYWRCPVDNKVYREDTPYRR